MKRAIGGRSKHIIAAAAATAALAANGFIDGGRTARASDYIGGNGSKWSSASNWNPAGVPSGSSATANINVAPDSPFSISMDFNYSAGSALASVGLNSANANALTLNLNADLFADGQYLATTSGGNATIVQAGFTNSASGRLLVGYASGST